MEDSTEKSLKRGPLDPQLSNKMSFYWGKNGQNLGIIMSGLIRGAVWWKFWSKNRPIFFGRVKLYFPLGMVLILGVSFRVSIWWFYEKSLFDLKFTSTNGTIPRRKYKNNWYFLAWSFHENFYEPKLRRFEKIVDCILSTSLAIFIKS